MPGFASRNWIVLFVCLILVLNAYASQGLGGGGDGDDIGMIISMGHHHHPTDPQLMVFFLIEDLKVGKVMSVYFPNRHLSSSHLLSKQEADAIPFSIQQLPYLLQLFSLSKDTPQAKAMEDTLRDCQTQTENPIKGETAICATSMDSVYEFINATFGILQDDTTTHQLKSLTTRHLKRSSTTTTTPLLQNYTVTHISLNMSPPKLVACHTMPYPYAVFYCHSQESGNKVLMVRLETENGDHVLEALSVCHMDTSLWNPNHVSFQVLGVVPGTTPVCHFFPADHFVFIPIPIAATM